MKTVTDKELLKGLREGNSMAFAYTYKIFYPALKKYVLKNSGTLADAEDLFQDTLIVLLRKTEDTQFKLTSCLGTYITAIGKNLWLKKLREGRKAVFVDYEQTEKAYWEQFEFELIEERSIDQILSSWISQATLNCQHLLNAVFLNAEPMEKFMDRMGYKNRHTADNLKYKCLQQVRRHAGTF